MAERLRRHGRVTFAASRAKERFIVHLRPEDIAAELRDRWRGDIGGYQMRPSSVDSYGTSSVNPGLTRCYFAL